MPLNEAAGWRRSSLTKQQKREEEAAIYGLRLDSMSILDGLSTDQLEQLGAELAARKQKQGGMREFDINNPPRQPYQHQEFPRMMYLHAKRETCLVQNAGELSAALDAGWQKEPFPAESEPKRAPRK